MKLAAAVIAAAWLAPAGAAGAQSIVLRGLDGKAGGAALPTGEGSFRLVIEGDLRPARGARMVTRITVTAPPAPSPAP